LQKVFYNFGFGYKSQHGLLLLYMLCALQLETVVGLEPNKQLLNILYIVELQTLQHIVALGRYDVVQNLSMCQQYLQTLLYIVVLGAESDNVVQLTQNESDTVVHYQ
jgi:hypothetical protein